VRLNRKLFRYRASLVKIQTGVKNKIHTILAKNNVSHSYSDLFGKEGMDFLHSLTLPENLRSISLLLAYSVPIFYSHFDLIYIPKVT